jgi:hypothetical protein
MPSLKAITRPVESLTARERTAMHGLMAAHYEQVPRQRFDEDLSHKDEVVVLTDDGGMIRGFTTIAWNPAGVMPEGDILYSGDTIIDRACWGTQELVRAFCMRAGEWRRQHPRRSLFWFLISKGHRTYMYLPLFARRFHPHPANEETALAGLAGRVAAGLFGGDWKPDEGVIRFSSSHGHLRGELAEGRSNNPWVRFFMDRNPGYVHGEELVCITEMNEKNLRRLALAAFRDGTGVAG